MHSSACLFALLAVPVAAEVTTDAFYTAIRENDINTLKRLVANASDVNMRDRRGATPLMHAAAVGSVDALRILLSGGADVKATSRTGATALLWSVSEIEKVRILIRAGSAVNARSKDDRTALLTAAWNPGSNDIIRILIENGADPKAVDASGNTALLAAASTGDNAMVRLLLEKGLDVNAEDSPARDTPLTAAAGGRNVHIVRLLLRGGANVNVSTADVAETVRHGPLAIGRLTPLLLAAPWGPPEMIRLLIRSGAHVNSRDIRGMTPLMLAVASETQDPEVVRILIANGADIHAKSLEGETAADWARKFGEPSVIRLFTTSYPARSVTRDERGGFQPARELRESVRKSVELLQRSSAEFFRQTGCVSCHHQDLAALAVSAAREKGVAVDEAAAAEQLKNMKYRWYGREDQLLAGPTAISDIDTEVYSLFGLFGAKYRPDATTDALVIRVARQQRTTGQWGLFGSVSRSPIEESDITRTALAIRMLQVYGPPALKPEFDSRITRAREWLLREKSKTTDDRAMRLLGLSWSAASHRAIGNAAIDLIRAQRSDGGWAPNKNLQSDAYATGEALYALKESGALRPTDVVYRHGADFLLSRQAVDGSWHVSSRAPKFQPYFESGFPYGHDQWISAAATAWATIALCGGVDVR
jgi:ankyrin repeat protein